jgi:hypothetical protein
LQKAYEPPSKTSRFRNQNAAHSNNFLLSSKTAFFTYKKLFFRTSLSLFLSKTTLFHPPPPIRTTLNLLSTKEYSCSFNLRSKSLRCKAGTSHRFKSSPAIPGEVAAFRKTGYLMNAGCFSNNHGSTGDLNRPRSPEVRKPLVYFWYFSYTRKVRKTFLSQEAPRFCKPRFSTPQPQLRTATIKTFYKGRSEVSQTSNQRTQTAISHKQT